MKITIFLSFLFAFVLSESANIISAIVIIGTGAKTPLTKLKDLEEKKKIEWEEGYNQITPPGLRQMYLLGRYMYKKYNDAKLLNEKFNPAKVLVRSLNNDNNLKAAQSFALGLYPGGLDLLEDDQKDKKLWLPPFEISFNEYVYNDLGKHAVPYDVPPVPVVTYNNSYEKLLSMSECKKYKDEWDEFFKSKVESFLKGKEKDFKDLCNDFSYKYEDLTTGDNIHNFLDYLSALEFHEKLSKEDNKKMEKVTNYQYDLYKMFFEEKKQIREILLCNFSEVAEEHFNKAKNNKDPRMLVLATDDINVLGYFFALTLPRPVESGPETTEKFKQGSSLEIILTSSTSNGADQHKVELKYNGKQVYDILYDDFLKKIKSDPTCWEELCLK